MHEPDSELELHDSARVMNMLLRQRDMLRHCATSSEITRQYTPTLRDVHRLRDIHRHKMDNPKSAK